MKSLLMTFVVLVSASAFAVENKDVECTLTRYTTEIDGGGNKINEKTVGLVRQLMKWDEATDDNSLNKKFEVDGISLSASLSSEKCWDDDRYVECNQRMVFLSIYNRQDGSQTSTYYDLNSLAAGAKMSITYQSPKGYHQISCNQK